MKVLVWQANGEIVILKGTLSSIKTFVLATMKYYYSEQELKEVEQMKTQFDLERAVRLITTDDEQFEVFQFVDVKEI